MAESVAILQRDSFDWTKSGGALRGTGVLDASGVERLEPIYEMDPSEEEDAWRALVANCPYLKAVYAKSHPAIVAGGFTVVNGTGRRGELFGEYARAFLGNLEARDTVYGHILEAEILGWRFWNASIKPGSFITAGGLNVLAPDFLSEQDPRSGAFTVDRDLVIRSEISPDSSENVFRTSRRKAWHPDQARWPVATFGSLSNPYGRSSARDAWLAASVWRESFLIVAKKAPWALGLIEARATDSNVTIEQLIDAGQKAVANANSDGIICSTAKARVGLADGGIDFAVGAWDYLKGIGESIILLMTGSHLSASQSGQGARAAAEVHELAPDNRNLSVANWAAETLRDAFIGPWLNYNFVDLRKGAPIQADEMPRIISGLAKQVDWRKLMLVVENRPSAINAAALAKSGGFEDLLVDPEAESLPLSDPPKPAERVADADEEAETSEREGAEESDPGGEEGAEGAEGREGEPG